MNKKAKRAARELLARFGHHLPVDVYAIAEAYSITLDPQVLEEAVSGLLVVRDDKAVISVNQSHDPHRQRFSVAHSLGHYLLHRNTASIFIDLSASPGGEGPLARKLRRKKVQELGADAFAAELLMPEAALKEQLDNRPLNVHDAKTIRRLAVQFGVSQHALTSRLTKLGLVSA